MSSLFLTAASLRNKAAVVLLFILISLGCSQKAPPVVRVPEPVITPPQSRAAVALPVLRPAPDRVPELRAMLDAIIESSEFDDAVWGVKIVSLDRHEVLYERNNRRLMMPASNMKIVTAAAALMRLGPEFRYETTIVTDGQIVNDRLEGDVIVIGSGDPTISSRMQSGDALAVFRNWAEELRSQGIRRIDGSIIGVDSFFDDERVAAGWPAHAFNSPYAAQVSALPFNDNVIAVHVSATRSGRLASVHLNPPTKYVRLQNRVITRAGHSNRFVAYRPEASNTIILRGRIGTRDRRDVRYLTVHEPAGYFATVLKETFEKKGIKVAGSRRASMQEGITIHNNLSQYKVLLTYHSLPLSVIVSEMMKQSQNLFAESLAKTISAFDGQQGSFDGAQIAFRAALSPLGIIPQDLLLEDGSGLSSNNFVTADLLSRILVSMSRQPVFPYFYQSFPVSGVDGTLSNRMIGTSAEARVHAKTGYIGGVRSLSGYTTTKDGERLAFVMLVNNFGIPIRNVDAAHDDICIQLTEFSRS